MIELNKLSTLEAGQRRRKMALTFGALERDILGVAEKDSTYNIKSMPRDTYIKTLIAILLKDDKLDSSSRERLTLLLNSSPFLSREACNYARHSLLSIMGTPPGEWDLIIAPHKKYNELLEKTNSTLIKDKEDNSNSSNLSFDTKLLSYTEKRAFYPGVFIYAEDIRSPFNIGSIFRTAEGLGAERVYTSPLCTSPFQKRALRCAMGAIDTMLYDKGQVIDYCLTLEEIKNKYKDIPIFALETGGTPIEEFNFPDKAVCIIGSEELGVSPEALKLASYGIVSIKMTGLKASLNVGVAFGILMNKWTECIRKRGEKNKKA